MKLGEPSPTSGIFRADRRGRHVFVDGRWCEIAGLTARQAIGEGWVQAVSPDDRERVVNLWTEAVESKTPFQSEYQMAQSGALVLSHAEVAADLPTGFIGAITDISALRERQIQLEYSVAQLAATLEGVRDGILVLDRFGRQQMCNARFFELLGVPRREAMTAETLNACIVQRLRDARDWPARIGDLQRETGDETEAVLELRDGRTLLLSCRPQQIRGCHAGRVFSFRDVTDIKQAEARLARRAYHDPLTGLPNRYLFSDRMAQAIARANRDKKKLAVLFIDLDHFKKINDRVGHCAADRMLQETAARISKCVREADTVARIGGDEFVVLLTSVTQPRDAGEVAAKILATLAMPFDDEARVSASIGIATLEHDGEDGDAILERADAAMYYAKRCGRNRYRYHTSAMSLSAA